jgi:hypothetical protein
MGKRAIAIGALAALVAIQVGSSAARAESREPTAKPDPLGERLIRAAQGLQGSGGSGRAAGRHTRLLGKLHMPGGLHGDVWAHGDFAYVGTWSGPCPGTGVKVVDVSDPARPHQVATLGSYSNTSDEDMEVLSVDTTFFTGDLLAVGLQDCGLEGQPPGLTGVDLWDVTVPASPSHLGFYEAPASFGVHEVSLTKQVSGDTQRVFALATVPFSEVTTAVFGAPTVLGDFQLVEVTDPASPVLADDWGAGKDGGLAFGADFFADLGPPFDCTPPAGQPDLCRGHFAAVFGHSASPSTDGNTAYVAYWDAGAIILDMSNPNDLQMIGRTQYPPDSEGDTHSAMPNEVDTVLVTTDEDFSPGELVAAGEPKEPGDTWGFARIWTISNPASPVHASDFATPHSLSNNTAGFFSAHNPQIRGNTLYLSWYSDGLRIVDIADPAHPQEVAFYRPKPTLDPTGIFQMFGPGGAHPIPFVWGVYPLGGRIYLSDINFGLYIVAQVD